jgi:hypothetical protein
MLRSERSNGSLGGQQRTRGILVLFPHSLLVLVPLCQEFAYRYQEALIADLLYALQAFRDRLDR